MAVSRVVFGLLFSFFCNILFLTHTRGSEKSEKGYTVFYVDMRDGPSSDVSSGRIRAGAL